ncbi:hypothetical protein [Streptomyces sp. TP-A0356]|uniref:hypothetical protein n=1 Tax=Streptomyces sp. TP-A0356 TaxID=1359208 RepID=UPI000A40B585|nr:hypothetical protein [Streptomyces sp. TP-A0356]
MTSSVEAAVKARIAAAKRRTDDMRRQRAELAAARKAGLARRNAQKLRRQAQAEVLPGSQENPDTVTPSRNGEGDAA